MYTCDQTKLFAQIVSLQGICDCVFAEDTSTSWK